MKRTRSPQRAWRAALGALLWSALGAAAQTNYTVKPGDTVEGIARQHGARVSALLVENNIDRPELLRPGRVLRIPPADAQSRRRYTVEEGDSLGAIAHDHGVSVSQIVALNGLAHPDALRIGQVLVIPTGGGDPPPPPARHALPTALHRQLDTIPVKPGRWKYIVIHHSATTSGTVQGMDQYHRHRRRMENGLAYHFVIGNGNGMRNGEIAIGRRWRTQIRGGHLASERLNEIAIGICLVGNFEKGRPTAAQMESLTALVNYLMRRTRTGTTAVRTHRQINTKPTECPGRYFPTRALLQGLP